MLNTFVISKVSVSYPPMLTTSYSSKLCPNHKFGIHVGGVPQLIKEFE